MRRRLRVLRNAGRERGAQKYWAPTTNLAFLQLLRNGAPVVVNSLELGHAHDREAPNLVG